MGVPAGTEMEVLETGRAWTLKAPSGAEIVVPSCDVEMVPDTEPFSEPLPEVDPKDPSLLVNIFGGQPQPKAETRPTFRAGDTVWHAGSGETWTLAGDEENGRVSPCGWPQSVFPAADCVLVEAAADEERLKMLREWAAFGKGFEHERDSRTSTARRQLVASGESIPEFQPGGVPAPVDSEGPIDLETDPAVRDEDGNVVMNEPEAERTLLDDERDVDAFPEAHYSTAPSDDDLDEPLPEQQGDCDGEACESCQ